MATCLLTLSLLVAAQAATAADAPGSPNPATFDCARGCTLSPDLVCGADGLTYMGACLAVCGGTTVLHPGACGPPRPPGASAFEPAAYAGPASTHPIAGAFDLSGGTADSDGNGGPPFVDAAALKQYEDQGLTLIGAATVGAYNMTEADAAAAAALAARAAATDPPPITDRRVLSVDFDTGLLYASRDPVPAEGGAGVALETPGSVPAGEEAVIAEIEEATAGEMVPDFQPSRWVTMTSTPPQPYRRVVWLDFGCSGAVIGPYAVGTAAHCLYAVGRGFYGPYVARPGAYRPSGGQPVSPFGAYPSKRFIVLAGWSGAGSQAQAWAYDAGVVITKSSAGDMSKVVGTMGYAYSPQGPTGTPLMTAGYPQTSQSGGTFVRYAKTCTTSDRNGGDTIIRTEISTCAICEGGQSGSPLWVGGSTPVIRSVLSRGTDDYDLWYEFGKAANTLWTNSKNLSA